MMARSRILLAAVTLSSLAVAGDVDLSGKYKDVAGGPIEFIQSKTNLMLKPDISTMPEQVKKFVGELRLMGTVTPKPERKFVIDAKYDQTLEPTPNMKLKVKIDLDAEGTQTAEGLVMKTCTWKVSAIAFAGGEIAGSENQERKCVGLWPRAH